MKQEFKLTYSTMFDPPEDLHSRFESALARARLRGAEVRSMWIGGRSVDASGSFEVRSPIDRGHLLATVPTGTVEHVSAAVDAARTAFRNWSNTDWRERVRLLRNAAALIEARVYDLSAVMALEVGKNRMESIGEVQETADLITWYCDQMTANDGFVRTLPDDPLAGFVSRNRTALRPHGVWAVIAPFNFPFALAGGPIAAALVTGNTVVFKVASSTALSGSLLMEIFRDAGLPDGVLNHVTGSGRIVGDALARHPGVAGITFTGSHEVGMSITREFAGGRWPRPCIAEMGGKNATIVTSAADLDRAATGIVRSAFGLQGQKCSACSRVYVERSVSSALRDRLVAMTRAITVGDPTRRENWMGPVIDERAQARYRDAIARITAAGQIHTGGSSLDADGLAQGLFVAPTVAAIPRGHTLWREELFLPIVLVDAVDSLDEAIALANDSDYGLTAGFYGSPREAEVFLERIEAGVLYLNRPQGATTGAWPGYQPFGGWKGSGSTGKAIGSFWYLPLYLREQSRTIVD
ncbi:MAG: hypothetical protein RIS35_732 [Pseudomonadota bacterium]|jgi:1-pyrroline-5-carboxylate dehydrogenase